MFTRSAAGSSGRVNAVHDLEKVTPNTSLYANRAKVYTKDVYGPVRTAKSAIMVFCLAVYYTLPWLRWNRGPGVPDQALLLDLWHERFYVFGFVLWPQDIYLLTGLLILGAISLFLVTSLFGRVWCGYTCPQTVWTDLFMTVERWIEGDRNTRMKRDAAPWSWNKLGLKLAKHWLWFWIAFWTGGAWMMYFVDAPRVVGEFWTLRADPDVYFFTFLFTTTTYLLAGWAREQVCTYMCPWPRFQSAMFDEQSIIVTYQGWRGEPRGHARNTVEKFGDCVDCDACVHVCPTGIDIRDGVQMECINCGLCIDACNHVMEKMDREPWLITWDTLARQKAKAEGRHEKLHLIRPRSAIYVAALTLCTALVLVGFLTKSTTTLSVIHDRAPMFVRLKDGGIRNAYTVKIANKTQRAATYVMSVMGLDGAKLSLPEQNTTLSPSVQFSIDAGVVGAFRVVLQGQPQSRPDGRQDVNFTLTNAPTGESMHYRALFFSPGSEKEN
jgi:cytochrome c oxidase accessory protein FixG